MSYVHLSTIESVRIQSMFEFGLSTRKIAEKLGSHHSKVIRELSRNHKTNYKAEEA